VKTFIASAPRRRRPAHLAALSLLLAAGCQTGRQDLVDRRPDREIEVGPPPPGHVKIVGEPVPNWKPADMFAAPRAGNPLSWSPLGPRPILDEFWSGDDDASGRVVSIATHPTDPDVVYIASASGGIWKTTDGGLLWSPLTDELSILNHGAVALDPISPDTVYAGTGEYTTDSSGDGLFRSTDAGVTWEQIGTAPQVGGKISRIAVDPTDSQVIHVSGSRGYVRSIDGGDTWSLRLFGSASDLVVNPDNPDILYVGRYGDGIYRSINGGDTLVELTGGLPTSGLSRIILAIAASNPNSVYAAIINNSSGLLGLYKTVNGGDNWTKMVNTPDFPNPQGWYDACMTVDPADEDHLYAGGVFPSYAVAGVIESTDGAGSWTDITVGALGGQLHPDQQTMAFGPDGTLWVGNDGGIWKTVDQGQSWINTNATLTVTQNYNIALHPSDPAQLIGGTQDNGTVSRQSNVEEWPQILGGDGGFAAYDTELPTRRYVTYVGLSVYRLLGGNAAYISGPWGSDPVNFIAPLVMDPNNTHSLLGGTNRVWRTTNAHTLASWTAISTSAVSGGGTLNAIAVAVGASNTIYTGSSTGRVYFTSDAANWFDRSAGLPGGQVSDLFIDPTDPAVVYVSFHNLTGSRVLRSEDFGANWTNVTGDLPTNVGAHALAVDWRFDPPALYVGAGSGVYASLNGGANWIKDGTDLPNANVGDLAIDPVSKRIFVGTYGRGAWMAPLPLIPGDIDADDDVDFDDASALIAVLLDNPLDEDHISRCDLDMSGAADGADLAPFILTLL